MDVFGKANERKEDGGTAVQVLLESKGLSFGAANAVSLYLRHCIQLSRGTVSFCCSVVHTFFGFH